VIVVRRDVYKKISDNSGLLLTAAERLCTVVTCSTVPFLISFTGGSAMLRLTAVTGCAIVLIAFLVGVGHSGDPKGGGTTKKVGLPKYWSRLNLTADQKDKISKVRTEYAKQIQTLKAQIKKLEQEEKAASYALLTDEQKEGLRKILGFEKASDKKPTADKKSSKDK
jgi:Spy/CpxP family protein refolding chaperone